MPDTTTLNLTPAEKEELLNALYFYQATMHLNLTGEEHDRLNALLDKLEPEAKEQE